MQIAVPGEEEIDGVHALVCYERDSRAVKMRRPGEPREMCGPHWEDAHGEGVTPRNVRAATAPGRRRATGRPPRWCPPRPAAPRAPSQERCGQPRLEGPELIRRAREERMHRADPAAHGVRRADLGEGDADDHAYHVRRAEHAQGEDGQYEVRGEPEHARSETEDDHGAKEGGADAPLDERLCEPPMLLRARPATPTAFTTSHTITTRRRSQRSATCPTTKVRSTIGTNCTRPTRPRSRALPVRL